MKIKISFSKIMRAAHLAMSVFLLTMPWSAVRAADIRDIVFPVVGPAPYSHDFGAPRSGGRTHEGIDIFGTKLQPLVAAQDGYLGYVPYPEPYYGYGVFLHGDDGYDYWYLHINNDTPGTDDGLGGGINAYAYDIVSGNPVTKGQLIGYMGDSGNAEATHPHLHFEIHRPDDNVIDPFLTLNASQRIAGPIFHPPLPGEILPFQKFQGGAHIARGDIDHDADGEEIIIGAGQGGGPHVKIYTADNLRLSEFFPYPIGFRGGVDVAAADVDGDGVDEVITGAGPGGGPQVLILDKNGNLKNQFFAYDPTFRGGVSVAAADLTGDGVAEIITGAGPGGGPHVRVFNRWGQLKSQFFAYDTNFRQGIDVAAKPATELSPGKIITGAGPGGGPHVRIFNRQGKLQDQFFAYGQSFRGGVNVSAANIYESTDEYEIAVVPAGHGVLTISTQQSSRRTSVRAVLE